MAVSFLPNPTPVPLVATTDFLRSLITCCLLHLESLCVLHRVLDNHVGGLAFRKFSA